MVPVNTQYKCHRRWPEFALNLQRNYLAELVFRDSLERVIEPVVEVEARAAGDRGRAERELAVDEQLWSLDLRERRSRCVVCGGHRFTIENASLVNFSLKLYVIFVP